MTMLRPYLVASSVVNFKMSKILILDQKAIHQLRKIEKINRLIYISCNPKLASKNFADLGRPESKYLHGEFFVPVKAVAVDLFPHTNHYELVISFKRWNLLKKELAVDSS